MLFHCNYCVCNERFVFPNGVIHYQSSEALGKGERVVVYLVKSLVHMADNSDQTGIFFLKIFHSRRKKSSPVGKRRKEPLWWYIPEFILGCAAQSLILGRAVVEHIPALEGGKCALHKCGWAKPYGLWGCFGELCLYYGWAKVQALCFFFSLKRENHRKKRRWKGNK